MEDEITVLEEPEKVYNIRHRAFHFSKAVISFISETKYERVYHSIFDQLLRSATSVGANLVERQAGSSKKDFLNFYLIALKSASETKYWLCLIRDTLQVDVSKTVELLKEADEISKIVGSIVVGIKNNR